MTRHRILCVLSFLLWCCPTNCISASPQENIPDAGADFNLSEPEVEASASTRVRPATTTPANSPARQVPQTVSGNAAPIQSDSAKNPGANAEQTNELARPSAAYGTRPPSGSLQSTRHAEPMPFELREFDVPAEPFFSGPIPRTSAIIGDASLNDVCHVGSRIWAVGERGVICFSDNAGATWAARVTPMECSLQSVCFLTNTIGWVAGTRTRPDTGLQSSAVLLHTRDGGQTWTDLTSAAGPRTIGTSHLPASVLPGIRHIQYFGLDTAVAVTAPMHQRSGNGIFRSEDGGHTWSPIPVDQTGGPWIAGHFVSESDGIVVGHHQSYAAVVADQAVVINRPEPTLRAIRSVSLDTEAHGWIAGDGCFILTTEDAGVTWKQPAGQIPPEITQALDLHTVAHSASTILLGGNPGACLLHSSNNGQDWKLVTVPMTGCLKRLHFISATDVIGVGSLGQIVRSADSGHTWASVRSTGFRAGLVNVITDADKAAWQLLSHVAAEQGVRSAVIQLSQPLSLEGNALMDGVPMSEQSTTAVTRLGANAAESHWMFPRTKPEHHRSSEQLVAEWNRQTDGRLRKLLPLRIARDIRNWRPSVVVIEPVSDEDAVAALMREVIPQAVSLAANDEDDRWLSQLGLSPWRVNRVVCRVPQNQSATITFRNDDLLPSLGTTSGLLHDATLKLFERPIDALPSLETAAGYELVFDASEAPSVASLFDQLNHVMKSDARRPYDFRSRDQVEILKSILQSAHVESTALTGHMQSAQTEDALIAQLYGIGANLPAALALRQLQDLADINLQQNNAEGYLAVQQEIVRRYPDSEEAQAAAEMLFLFYSSAEARLYRLGASHRKTSGPPSTTAAIPSIPGVAQSSLSSPSAVQPKIQAAATSPFSSDATNAMDALHQRWDAHAMTALRILSKSNNGNGSRNPLVLLRTAANYRLQETNGEQSTALSEVSQRDDQYGLFARCEMQVTYMPAAPLLPLINLPKRSEPPFLDGVLTDSIWEDAEEILLIPFVRDSLDPLTGTRRKSLARGEDISSLTMLAWDDEFLYLGARLQRAPEKLQPVELAMHRSYDSKHENRDRLELEIDTDRDFGTSFQLTIDESGQTSDRCWMLDQWNPKWYVALDADNAAWRIEAAIPLKELCAAGAKPGDLWNIRLRRIIPGVLQHELQTGTNPVSTDGTGMVRFIRPRRTTASSRR
ncbi:MAG: hypothetical protein KDB01_05190 [Planctomycetaceae bacterium]|nr:hypothetical protein [Planctomycetaceae bacterium]